MSLAFSPRRHIFWNGLAVACCWLTFAAPTGNADDRSEQGSSEQGAVSFSEQIQPIFRDNCQGCHQPAKAMGAYMLTDYERSLSAGETGEAAIVPGDPEASYLLAQIEPVDGVAAMPKDGPPLKEAEIALIRRWIAQGAEDDSPPAPEPYSQENLPKYQRPPVVTALDYSPDGKWLAVSGFHEVLIIDTESWVTEKRLVGLSERIESVCFSPDSKRLAVTGGSPGRFGEVQVWDIERGELTMSRQLTYDTLSGGVFSPDGTLVAFGGTDNVVRALDAETGEQRLQQGTHEDWIAATIFNPSGTHLVSAGRDMTVKLTEVETERFVDNITSITPGALRGGVNSLDRHPERDEILVGGADGIPKIYRIFRETARQIGDDANLVRQFSKLPGRIFSIDLSADGERLVVASTLDGASHVHVYPYDFNGEIPEDVKAALAKRVANRSAEEKERVAQFKSQTSDALLKLEIPDSIYAVAFAPDGQRVVVGGADGMLRVVSVETAEVEQTFNPVPLDDESSVGPHRVGDILAGHGLPIDSSSLPAEEDQRTRLPRGPIESLQVSPSSIELTTPSDYAQLVITATYASGQQVDVTRLASIQGYAGVSVTEMGLVRPEGAGRGELRVELGGQQLTIPARVGVLVGEANTRDALSAGEATASAATENSEEASSPSAPKPPEADEDQYRLEELAGVDFVRDVNPLLSRLGCNSGTCHGSQQGKNGFQLSLRGYDPLGDVRSLSDDWSARRLNVAAPTASLMLLKPTGEVPHQGGVLLDKQSVYYAILRQWISEGAALDGDSRKATGIELFPKNPVIDRAGAWQQFRVVARYADGSSRDVTHEAFVESGNTEVCENFPGARVKAIRRGEAPVLVRYEGAYAASTVTVMGDRDDFVWQEPNTFSRVDELVAEKWQRMKIRPSRLCTDAEFLRRVMLDLTGLPPTAEEVKEFLADQRPSRLKRQAKIDQLIGGEAFIDHWTNKWADLLQVNSKFLGTEGASSLRQWIETQIAGNRPYDEFAREILTANGSNKDNPAASYYKILRDPDAIMENTTHLFLAVRFNCNKCHDHPFERWTQDQYYQLSAYFARTGLKRDPASGDQNIGGSAVEGAKPLYEEVFDKPEGEMLHVRTEQPVAPRFPYECDYEAAEDATRREQLAAWITSPDNPYFARSYVNRLWGYLLGRGLIEPLDDIRAGNPPTNPELLDHLTEEFIRSGFDTQHVLRLITSSRTYQLSVATNQWNEDDEINFSHAIARRLPAEVLYDAVYQVTGAVSDIPGVAPGTRAAELPDVAVQLPDGFLNNLGRPVRESACECERSSELQLGPVMALVSGPTVGKAIGDPRGELPKMVERPMSDQELIEEIYLRVLSRLPGQAEVDAVLQAAKQISKDHRRLQASLEEREAWWNEEFARREEQRKQELLAAKEAIEAREQEIAPERERLEEERRQRIAAAEEQLQQYAADPVAVANSYLESQDAHTEWHPLAPHRLQTSNSVELRARQDRSILATGEAGKGSYTLTFRTSLSGIRGLRLEALPQPEIKGGGPGLPENGNFVLTELQVDAAPVGQPDEQRRIKFSSAKADFSQQGFSPEQAIDGKTDDQQGWAIHPRGGLHHWATFEASEPLDIEGEVELTVTLHQNHNAVEHRLAHFRISLTTDTDEIRVGLPEAFAAARSTAPESRKADDIQPLIAYLQEHDAKWGELRQAVATAKQPIPPDPRLIQLQAQAKALEETTPLDPKLAQLREDFEHSQTQLQNERLTLAQDLTWALINSPAFLFNH